MASNQTSNYGLNQWEATDQVLRTDFNADNLKVDTALKSQATSISNLAVQITDGLAEKAARSDLEAETAVRAAADEALEAKAGMQLISRTTLSEPVDATYLDLTTVDWSQWATVRIIMKPVLDQGDTYRASLNSSSTMQLVTYATSLFQLILFPSFQKKIGIFGIFWPESYGEHLASFELPFQSLQHVEFVASDNVFYRGTVIEVWGAM